MSLLMATALMAAAPASALAATAAAGGTCSWNDPGHNRYRGTLSAAVDRYTDIPAPVRERLKARMTSFRYDEMAAIRRDSITGHARYAPEIRDMHFGAGQVCGQVDRSRWDEHMVERGLVYCEGEHCLIVPTVCRNVSRVTRLATPEQVRADNAGAVPGSPLAGAGPAGLELPAASGPATTVAGGPDSELVMEPTSAGPSFESTRTADGAAPVSTTGSGDGGGAGGGSVPPALGPVWWSGVTTGGGGFGPAGNNNPAPEPISVGNIGGPIGPTNPPATPTTPGGGPDPFPGPFPGPSPFEPPLGPTEPTGPWAQDPSTSTPVASPIPEPASGLLALLGVAGLFGWRKLRAR
jgi:hypothetical protein